MTAQVPSAGASRGPVQCGKAQQLGDRWYGVLWRSYDGNPHHRAFWATCGSLRR